MKIVLCLLSILVFSCSNPKVDIKTVNSIDNWDYQSLKVATPESQGVDSEHINKLLKSVEDISIDSVVILRNGYKIFEKYNEPFTKEMTHNLYSSTKSINATLIGIAIDKGLMRGVTTKVIDIFPEYRSGKLDPIWEEITIKHLLTMSAGLPVDNSEEGTDHMVLKKNWLKYIFSRNPEIPSYGLTFYYSNITSFLLSAILTKETGYSALDFAREHLFKPLGITSYSWDLSSPQGINFGLSNLNLKTTDMAKIGQLYLNKGVWNGERIISEKWISESVTKDKNIIHSDVFSYGYGYQWWLNKDGSYSAKGLKGQYIFIYPKHNIVIAMNSFIPASDNKSVKLIESLFTRSFLRNLSDEPLPEKEHKVENSDDKVEIIDDIEFDFTNKMYSFKKNKYGVKNIYINVKENNGSISFNKGLKNEFSFPFDNETLNTFIDITSNKQVNDYFLRQFKSAAPYSDIAEYSMFSKIMVENKNISIDFRVYPNISGIFASFQRNNIGIELEIQDYRKYGKIVLQGVIKG